MPPRFGDYMEKTAGGTDAAASSSYGGPPSGGSGGMGSIGQTIFNVTNNQGTNNQGTNNQGTDNQGTDSKDEDTGSGIQNEIIQNILYGTTGDKKTNIKDFQKSGKHPLRAQLDYLVAKYGDSVLDTEQGKVLMGYLSGVPVERGGGLGARDDTYGGSAKNIDPTLEKQRQELIKKISMMGTPFGATDIGTLLAGVTREGIGADLTPEQYFNFRQQLMAADPTAENQAYKDAFPFSSGAGLESVSRFIPGLGTAQTFLGGFLPERNMAGYQGMTDNFAAGFTPLPIERGGVASLPFAFARNTTPPSDDEEGGQDDDTPTLPPVVPQTPFTPFNINAFYANLPQYTQQGIMNPNLMSYYQNLGTFPGVTI